MFALLLTLFALCLAGSVCLAAVAVAKFTIHAMLWSLKLLFLPFLLAFAIVKVSLIFMAAVVVFALLIPVFVIGLLLAVPLLALTALT